MGPFVIITLALADVRSLLSFPTRRSSDLLLPRCSVPSKSTSDPAPTGIVSVVVVPSPRGSNTLGPLTASAPLLLQVPSRRKEAPTSERRSPVQLECVPLLGKKRPLESSAW